MSGKLLATVAEDGVRRHLAIGAASSSRKTFTLDQWRTICGSWNKSQGGGASREDRMGLLATGLARESSAAEVSTAEVSTSFEHDRRALNQPGTCSEINTARFTGSGVLQRLQPDPA